MKRSIVTALLISLFSIIALSQNVYDSLISSLNTEAIQGRVITYYTPGNNKIATDLQRTITDAVNFYEKDFSGEFQIKLAVLDSVQWPSDWFSFLLK